MSPCHRRHDAILKKAQGRQMRCGQGPSRQLSTNHALASTQTRNEDSYWLNGVSRTEATREEERGLTSSPLTDETTRTWTENQALDLSFIEPRIYTFITNPCLLLPLASARVSYLVKSTYVSPTD